MRTHRVLLAIGALPLIALCAQPALAERRAPTLQRVNRLYYADLIPRGQNVQSRSVELKRLRQGKWKKEYADHRRIELTGGAPFRLEGTIWGHDGRTRTSVLTNGRRVLPYNAFPVQIEGRLPRKGSKKRADDLPFVTALEVHTDLPAIRKLAASKGWVKRQRSWSEGDLQLRLGEVKLRYRKNGSRRWKTIEKFGRGDLELYDVSPRDRLQYEATVSVSAYGLGGRQFVGEEQLVFAGER